ncbi:inositol-3-phosphate synthase [Streptomyces sp. NEAU-H3]|uniref:inositol-3-phosphate synthase n=1 Tax=Streptomyces sp. NEAU-H3 TaxID=2720636 RepID=UPI0035B67F5C
MAHRCPRFRRHHHRHRCRRRRRRAPPGHRHGHRDHRLRRSGPSPALRARLRRPRHHRVPAAQARRTTRRRRGPPARPAQRPRRRTRRGRRGHQARRSRTRRHPERRGTDRRPRRRPHRLPHPARPRPRRRRQRRLHRARARTSRHAPARQRALRRRRPRRRPHRPPHPARPRPRRGRHRRLHRARARTSRHAPARQLALRRRPALAASAAASGLPYAGRDGKTGQTLLRSVLAPMFHQRALAVRAWSGSNLLGGGDGAALADPAAAAAKNAGKERVLADTLGTAPEGEVHIDDVPAMGDFKTAWDHIAFDGFLGTRMILQTIWQGVDSSLAAPLVLDLARLLARAHETGLSGPRPELGFFFKDPDGGSSSLAEQYTELLAFAGRLGETR